MPIAHLNKRVIDQKATGQKNAKLRLKLKIKQCDVAALIGMKTQNLCHLEHGTGNSRWNEELIAKYEAALKRLTKA